MAVPTIEAPEIDNGAGDAISAPDADGVQTLSDPTGSAFVSATMSDGRIIIAGSGVPGNNGNFPVVGVPAADQIRFLNSAGAAEAVFPGTWSVTENPISPARGHSGGRNLIEIYGTNFRLTPPPPVTGFVGGDYEETVEVLIGGRRAKSVMVITTDRLIVETQSHEPGLVEVTVRNIDSNGVVIPGETTTLLQAFLYARPRLDDGVQSDLVRLVRTLIRELKKQIIPNVALTSSTDYDPDAATPIIEIAQLPAIVLVGPSFEENRFYTNNEITEETDPVTFEVDKRQAPRVVDVIFTLIGATDGMTQLMNLLFAVENFFRKNKDLLMLRTPPSGDPNVPFPVDPDPADLVRYEMDIVPGQQFAVSGGPNNSNLRQFSGAFLIRGFEIEEMPDFPGDLLETRTREVLQSDLSPVFEQF